MKDIKIFLSDNRKYGFSSLEDGNWKVTIPAKYDYADDFYESLARINLGGKWGQYGTFQGGKWGFVDEAGQETIPLIYTWVDDFTEGLARVNLGGKPSTIGNTVDGGEWGYIGKTGEKIIPLVYSWAGNFRNGLATVELNGKWGFIDKVGNVIIPIKYDEVEQFKDGRIKGKLNGKWSDLDETGKEIIPEKASLKNDTCCDRTLAWLSLSFTCDKCAAEVQFPAKVVDKEKGIFISCFKCHSSTFITPAIWCQKCGIGIVNNWEELIGDKPKYLDPYEKKYLELANDLIAKHGELTQIHYLSHYPKFEIKFHFKDGTSLYSGERTGNHDIHFLSMGYAGEGPRYTKVFLEAAKFPVTYDDIIAMKPGYHIKKIDGKIVITETEKISEQVESKPIEQIAKTNNQNSKSETIEKVEAKNTTPVLTPSNKKWWQFWK